MGVNEMTHLYGETVRCFEIKERLTESVCYISFNATTTTNGKCGIFQLLICMITNDVKVHVKLNTGLSWREQHTRTRRLFSSKLDLNLRKKLGTSLCVVLKLGNFGK
jgi:hypothetical protein